jgi:hypothetical protein
MTTRQHEDFVNEWKGEVRKMVLNRRSVEGKSPPTVVMMPRFLAENRIPGTSASPRLNQAFTATVAGASFPPSIPVMFGSL